MVIGAHGAVVRVGLSVTWWLLRSEFGADLGPDPGLVELLLLIEESFLFLFGFLLVHALPLPFVEAAGEGAGAAAHGAEEGEGVEEGWGGGGVWSTEDGGVHFGLEE